MVMGITNNPHQFHGDKFTNIWEACCLIMVHRGIGVLVNDYNISGQIWTRFWNEYEKVYPDFEVFSRPFDRTKTAAFLIHGDEARTFEGACYPRDEFTIMLGTGL